MLGMPRFYTKNAIYYLGYKINEVFYVKNLDMTIEYCIKKKVESSMSLNFLRKSEVLLCPHDFQNVNASCHQQVHYTSQIREAVFQKNS